MPVLKYIVTRTSLWCQRDLSIWEKDSLAFKFRKRAHFHLPLEVMKRKLVSLTEKLIGVPSMDDFSWPDLTAVSKGVSTSDALDFSDAVNLRFDCTGSDLLTNENGIVSLDDKNISKIKRIWLLICSQIILIICNSLNEFAKCMKIWDFPNSSRAR